MPRCLSVSHRKHIVSSLMSVTTPGAPEVHRSRTFPSWRLKFLCKMFMCDPHRKEKWGSIPLMYCWHASQSIFIKLFFLLMLTLIQRLETAGNGYLQPCFTQDLSKFLSKMFSTCATGIPLPLDAHIHNMTSEFMTQCIYFPSINPQFLPDLDRKIFPLVLKWYMWMQLQLSVETNVTFCTCESLLFYQ